MSVQPIMDVDSMTVSELKKELKSRGLRVGGKKADLKARLTEALATDTISATDSTHNEDADTEQQTDFADFENYINDEYNKINAQNNGDASHDEAHAVSIDDIIEKQTEAAVEAEEKQILFATDFDLNASTDSTQPIAATPGAAVTAPDFAEDDNALNSPSKVQSRYERFGNAPLDEAAKVESRKRRFAAMAKADGVGATDSADGGNKKARLDPEVERKRILERAQKFGTKLPADLKLTAAEAAVVHAEQIKRAERFGTQHLLPKEIKQAEFDAKRAERMKRFQTGQKATADEADKAERTGKIIAAAPDKDSTKVAERRLRFGTTAPIATQKQGKGKGKKLGPNRKERDQKKFKEFRQHKKNNRNNRGRGRGGRGRAGRGGNGSRSRGRGANRGRNGNGNGNGGYNANSNRQQQQQQAQAQFSAADRAKIEERKLRFSGGL